MSRIQYANIVYYYNMEEPTLFAIVKYVFFIVSFIIAFIMIKNENLESLGVSVYTVILLFFVISTLVDIFRNYHPAKNLLLPTVSLSGSSILTLAASIIFVIAITKLNSTFLENGQAMKLSATNRTNVTHTEDMFLLSTILIFFISMQTYFHETSVFTNIIHFLKMHVLKKGTIGFALICIGIIVSVSLLYKTTLTDSSPKDTNEYKFKRSIEELSLFMLCLFGFMTIYLSFIGLSLIAPTIFYMPDINIYLNGLFTLLLSGLSMYYVFSYFLPGTSKPWGKELISSIVIFGIVALFIGGSLLKLSGMFNIGGLLANLGNYDLYSLINKILILSLFLFVFSKSFVYYKELGSDTPYNIAYISFVVLIFIFFGVSNSNPDMIGSILNMIVYTGIPILSLLIGVYLLYLSNKAAPLWRNQLTK
jgi:hypothetical protein